MLSLIGRRGFFVFIDSFELGEIANKKRMERKSTGSKDFNSMELNEMKWDRRHRESHIAAHGVGQAKQEHFEYFARKKRNRNQQAIYNRLVDRVKQLAPRDWQSILNHKSIWELKIWIDRVETFLRSEV